MDIYTYIYIDQFWRRQKTVKRETAQRKDYQFKGPDILLELAYVRKNWEFW